MMFLNLITQMWSSISLVDEVHNEFNYCMDSTSEKLEDQYPDTVCGKFGFYQAGLSELNVHIIQIIR